ncbi:uncharacterized protein [Clytia hemisphaerica]|uniref:uncharacterized protein n=1 Tax=Clytia hemisphaerica TaxID=252671 RepID=UPI0034D5DF3A
MKQFHERKPGTINVRTAREDEKLEKVIKEIDKAKLSVCGLQEVRRIKTGSALIKIQELDKTYEVYWSGHSSKRQNGVGIVIKVDSYIIVEEIKCINARLIAADINLYGCSIRIVNCYAPTEDSTTSSKDIFYTTLRKQLITDNNRR